MDRWVEEIEGWEVRPVAAGFDGLRSLAAEEFSGAVSAGDTWLFLVNGRGVGVFEYAAETAAAAPTVSRGTLDALDGADLTARVAPHHSIPLLVAMQAGETTTRARYYTEDTPIPEVHETLTDGGFTGYLELSENVLSGDYYVVYQAGRSAEVAFIGTSRRVETDEDAFERACEEVGIYEVVAASVEPVDLPEPEPDRTTGTGGTTAAGAGVGAGIGATDPNGSEAADATSAEGPGPGTADATGDPGASPTADREDTPSPEAGDGDETEPRADDTSGADGGSSSALGELGSLDELDLGGASEPDDADESSDDGGDGSGGTDPGRTLDAADIDAGAGLGTGTDTTTGTDTASGAGTAPDTDADTTTGTDTASDAGTPPDTDADTTTGTDFAGGERDGDGDEDGSDAPAAGANEDPHEDLVPAITEIEGDVADADGSAGTADGSAGAVEGDGSEAGGPGDSPQAGTADAGAAAALRERLAEREVELDAVRRERDELAARVSKLEAAIEELRAGGADADAPSGASGDSGASGTAAGGEALPVADALAGTNLFVRYRSKGAATLSDAADGDASREELADNLRIEHHTGFEAAEATVDGRPFEAWLTDTHQFRFLRWLVTALPFEIRETGSREALRELDGALPEIDRVELDGTVATGEGAEASFDLVALDQMGDPLLVAGIDPDREPVAETGVADLVRSATSVAEAHPDLAAAFHVTEAFFEPRAMETAREATSGSLLSRDSRRSFVKISRNRGYHLCLVEARGDSYYLSVPDL